MPHQPSWSVVADEISRDILAIHLDSYGRGAGRVEAHLVSEVVIVLLDQLELMPSEEFLIAKGHREAVLGMRSEYQQAIEATFRAAVERATGRTVVGFFSHTWLDEPRCAIEVFRLAPAAVVT